MSRGEGKESFFLDTSIPMYAAGRPSPYKAACISLLERVEKGEVKAVIDVEVIQEILYRFFRLSLSGGGEELARQLLRLGVVVLPITRSDIEAGLDLHERYASRRIPPRDTLHVAVMQNNDLRKILSFDKHFDAIEEVERIDPLKM